MEREVYASLVAWKEKKARKPLVIRGARQVGKTWIVKEFGKNEFSSLIYINCDSNPQVEELFRQDYNVSRILRGLPAISGIEIKAGSTLIFLDEIQEIPRAIRALKYFYEDAPEYHVVAGSLLRIHEHRDISFPVGKVESILMHPMTFPEFVLAVRGEAMYRVLRDSPLGELNGLHSSFVELLREYYFTGGMPEIVSAFIAGKSPAEIRGMQKDLLSAYIDDISKHTTAGMLNKIGQVWASIPAQLSRENKKFVYANIERGARAKEYENAIGWLCDSGMVVKVGRIRKCCIPLKFYEDFSAFKLFFFDCGLLGALTDVPPSEILIGNNIFEEYKGAFSESYVMQQLSASMGGYIFYYSADESREEIDFVFQHEDRIVPVEVKAEENLRAKSLRQLCTRETIKGTRVSMSPYRDEGWMVNIPLYAVCRIAD